MNIVKVSILALIASAHVQSAAADSAPDPRLGAAPSSSAWTISYQYKTPNPALKLASTLTDPTQAEWVRTHNARLSRVEILKAGNDRKEVYLYDNQTTVTKWIVGDIYVSEDPQQHMMATVTMKDPGAVPFTHDFDSLAWVDRASYKGHQISQGVDCCVYVGKSPADGREETAFIDAKTELPVCVQEGDTTLVYTYKPSSESIEVPANVSASIKAYIPSPAP